MTLSILLGIEGIWQLIVLLLLYFLLYVIPITLCAKRARKFNRNGIAWGILGFFFSYIAVLFVYRLPAEKTKVEVVSETNRGKMEQQKKTSDSYYSNVCFRIYSCNSINSDNYIGHC